MQNDKGEMVDMYIPRKCSWTKRLITAKDHAAVQINVGNVDPATGKYTGDYKTFALCGYVRDKVRPDKTREEQGGRWRVAPRRRLPLHVFHCLPHPAHPGPIVLQGEADMALTALIAASEKPAGKSL